MLERRLAAILAADVVGYSRLMGEDEAATLQAVNSNRKELFDPKSRQYHGRTVKLMGDGALLEFASAVDAVAFAVEIQCAMQERNSGSPDDRRIIYRVGINIGDVIIEGDDIFGDGVNIAARLEALADPGGICIARYVLDQVKGKLDLNFEDLGEKKLKNIAEPISAYRVALDDKARGLVTAIRSSPPRKRKHSLLAAAGFALFALIAGLAWWAPWEAGPGQAPLRSEPAVSQSDKPVIAVLPFDNMSRDSQQEYFSDGITDDVITDLSHISGLFVIARNTMFTYKGKPIKVQRVGRELGAGYVLEGSVQKAGNRIRVNAQLIDARTGHHVWADRYDRELSDVFALQDDVVQKIVAALSVKLRSSEKDLLSRSAQAHPEAYDMLLRGLEKYRRFTRETIDQSREYFERAIALDPTFSRAYADLALTHIMAVELGFSDDPDSSTRKALKIAQQALALDDTAREVHFVLANIFRTMKRHDRAIAAARHAIALDPNYADGYAQLAVDLNYAGRPNEGLTAIKHAMQLNPRHPFFYVWILGQSYYLLDRYDEAARQFERVKISNPNFTQAHKMLAATYSALGRADDAEWAAIELKTLIPDFSLKRESASAPYKDEAVFRRYIDRLRQAGLREGFSPAR